MKKRIIAALMAALLVTGSASVWAETGHTAQVAAVDGSVSFSCDLNVAEGTPVLITILKAILNDAGEDVTAERVAEMKSPAALNALTPEYVAVVKVGEGGVLTHSCQMKDSLETGLCHVVISYLGSDRCQVVAGFEHVGRDDLKALTKAFNDATAGAYDGLIQADMADKNILQKSSADTEWYATLDDPTEFCKLLAQLKPTEGGFTIGTLIAAFNEAAAWLQLRSETDTLGVLKRYNGTYWNVLLDEASDFAALSSTEQTALLTAIRSAAYTTATTLEKEFNDGVVLAVLREVQTREALEELIAENSKYAAYFETVRSMIAAANIDAYTLSTVYNSVIQGASSCKSMRDVEALFKGALPTSSGGSSSGAGSSGGSSGGGSKVSASAGFSGKPSSDSSSSKPVEESLPFKDVSTEGWAYSYIQRLYAAGAVNGIESDSFAPTAAVARQDFVKMLMGILGITPSKLTSVFNDMPDGHYSEGYVMAAYERGFISGIGDDAFGVGQSISREDVAVILQRVLVGYGIEPKTVGQVFSDGETAADYAKDAISILSSIGIFSGDENGCFNPKADISRAETCAVLCRLADRIKGE